MAPSPSSTASSSVSSGRMLAIYLRHHVAASRGGVDLFHRSARTQLSNEARQELRDLAAEVTQDREQLLRILRRLDISRPKFAEVLVGVAEGLRQLKPNGTLLRRSPLSDVMELEALSTAVTAKRLGWVTLRFVGERDGPLDPGRDRRPDRQGRRPAGTSGGVYVVRRCSAPSPEPAQGTERGDKPAHRVVPRHAVCHRGAQAAWNLSGHLSSQADFLGDGTSVWLLPAAAWLSTSSAIG